MAFGTPPAGGPPAPAAKPKMTLANASASGTTAGAPTPLSVGAPQAPAANGPPAGVAPANPVVAKHTQKSVGTHQSQSPNKRGNPTFGMSK